MGERDQYFLGYREAEQDRLQRQALELAGDSAWLFEQVGLGIGPVGSRDRLWTARVSRPTRRNRWPHWQRDRCRAQRGSRNGAKKLLADLGLGNVEVRHGDGRDTGLPRSSFDLVTSRLVLVNVPEPEALVAEAAALAKPGGAVVYHEAVWPVHTYDPPLAEWDRLFEIMQAYADLNGIDLFVGRRVARLLREHGLVDVKANAITHLYPIDHGRRMLALDFVENMSDRFVDHDLVSADELADLKTALRRHLEDPETFVISCLYVQAWGRRKR